MQHKDIHTFTFTFNRAWGTCYSDTRCHERLNNGNRFLPLPKPIRNQEKFLNSVIGNLCGRPRHQLNIDTITKHTYVLHQGMLCQLLYLGRIYLPVILVTNNEVLQRADMPSIEAMLLSWQLTWTGHVVRMNDDRLPKTVLYGELWQAKRNVGRRHLRYMNCTKRHLHAANWEEMTHERSAYN